MVVERLSSSLRGLGGRRGVAIQSAGGVLRGGARDGESGGGVAAWHTVAERRLSPRSVKSQLGVNHRRCNKLEAKS